MNIIILCYMSIDNIKCNIENGLINVYLTPKQFRELNEHAKLNIVLVANDCKDYFGADKDRIYDKMKEKMLDIQLFMKRYENKIKDEMDILFELTNKIH